MSRSRILNTFILSLAIFLACSLSGRAQRPQPTLAERRTQAEGGDANSQYVLGLFYIAGEGVQIDALEAARWWRKAADQGHAEAQANLGALYLGGIGIRKDEIEAYRWMLLASAQGNPKAIEGCTLLEKILTSAQRTEGQRLAREFKARQSP